MADPQLGYGERDKADINSVNVWMGQQPWYQQLLKSFGQTPDNVHLDDSQKQAVIRAAQANGVVVDEGGDGQEVDDSGNFRAKGHKLRNTMIVAGIAAAALATMGAAGAFAGGAGGAASGATGAGAHALYDTTALYGAAGGGTAAGSTAAATGGGLLSKVGGLLKGKTGELLGDVGKGIGAATDAATARQYTNAQLGLQTAEANSRAQEAYQGDLQNLSQQERDQRASDVKNLAHKSFAENPFSSPFNPAGPQKYSAGYMQGLSSIEQQALARLSKDPTYDPTKIAPKQPVPYAPDLSMSGAQTAGNILSPALTIAGDILTPKQKVSDALAPYLRYLVPGLS